LSSEKDLRIDVAGGEMYPEHLKTQYWDEVAILLSRPTAEKSESYPEDAVRGAIAKFRDRLAPHEIGDLIYHQNAKDTAEAIRTNFLSPTTSKRRRTPARHGA